MVKQSLEEATEQSSSMTSSKSAERRSSMVLRNGYLKIGYQLWQKEERRKDFNIIHTVNQFLYFRAIQCHSGDNAIDAELQDNVLLPKGFTEYIYHVGNASELNSTIRNGLIPRGKSLIRGRQAVFFTTVNPMDDGYGMGETPRSSDETKDRAIQEHLETLSKYGSLVQFEARPRERPAILPDTVICSRSLQHTACSLH